MRPGPAGDIVPTRVNRPLDLRPGHLRPGPPAKPAPVQPSPRLRGGPTYGLILAAGIAAGVASATLAVGQWLVAAYAVVVLVFRLPSRVSFLIALAALALVPVFTIMGRGALAENYAVYAYFLLAIGVVAAVRELRRDDSGDVTKPRP